MSKNLRMLIMIVAAIVFVVSAGKIGWHYYQLYTAGQSYDSILEVAVAEEEEIITEEEETISTISIDFDALRAINPDIVAWIYIPDTPISYPILCGANNQTYLTTTFDRKSNILGSIFQDYRNNKEFKDLNTVIYGHNTRNDSMFGSLKKYKDQTYADEHPFVHIITDTEVRLYEVFSVYETPATSDTYIIWFGSGYSYANYLSEMAKKTVVNAGRPPGEGGSIVTLSTCTGGAKVMRLVLQAKFVKSYPVKS